MTSLPQAAPSVGRNHGVIAGAESRCQTPSASAGAKKAGQIRDHMVASGAGPYSTASDRASFAELIRSHGDRPLFVVAVEGAATFGYEPAGDGLPPLRARDHAGEQSIPSGLTLADLYHLVDQGVVRRTPIPRKPRDARFSGELVNVSRNRPGCVAMLSSAELPVFQYIAQMSGFPLGRATYAAQNGIMVGARGAEHKHSPLTSDERDYLNRVKRGVTDALVVSASKAVSHLVDERTVASAFAASKTPLVKSTTYGYFVNWSPLLDVLPPPTTETATQDIGKRFRRVLDVCAECAPSSVAGSRFHVVPDGATLQLGIPNPGREFGFLRLLEAHASHQPTAVVYVGYDVNDGTGNPGIDYAPMMRRPALIPEKIPSYNLHVLPWLGYSRDSAYLPDESRQVSGLAQPPEVAAVVPSPSQVAEIIMGSTGMWRSRE